MVPDAGKCGKGSDEAVISTSAFTINDRADEGGRIDKNGCIYKTIVSTKAVIRQGVCIDKGDPVTKALVSARSCIGKGDRNDEGGRIAQPLDDDRSKRQVAVGVHGCCTTQFDGD